MKVKERLILIIFVLLVTTGTCFAQASQDMVLWYQQPGTEWTQGLPIGNGMIGAMVFGGVQQERIALNESSFWSGRPHNYDDPNAGPYFSQIKDLVFAEKFQEAESLANDHFWGIPNSQEAYQPIGDLILTFENNDFTDYRRELDMQTGIAKVSYHQDDAIITRETFVSWPDKVLVMRISSDKPGKVNFRAKFQGPYLETSVAENNNLVMDGTWKGPFSAPATGMDGLIARTKGNGLKYEASLISRLEGGQSEAWGDTLKFKNANSVTLVMSIATSFVNYKDISGDPKARCKKVLEEVADKDFSTLYRRHIDDFSNLMGRVHLQIGDASANEKPTNERLRAFRNGDSDINLEALAFQFGRYILASSSREGGQPANLQGIWNEATLPPWGSKYTANINVEMNYWPAEVCNLTECHQPLFGMIKDLSEGGSRTAKTYYNSTGWVLHHNTDLWRGTAPVDAARYGIWSMGGVWLCQHLWEHYAFSGDKEFLKENYPVMKRAAQFLLDTMVEDPKHNWLVAPVSMSPEHRYQDKNGNLVSVSPGTTIDIALIHDLFSHCIEAGKILNTDQDFSGKLTETLKRIPPYRINSQGSLQEWIEDWTPGTEGHNTSPNFPMFPGSSITLRGTPDLAAAINKGMEARRPGGGWIGAWNACVWARLERGEMVEQYLKSIVGSYADNMQNPHNNQLDSNFGFTAAVAEALLQSHAGEINLLPALPPGWSNGSVKGLRARGDFEVSIKWIDGTLTKVTVFSRAGNEFVLKYKDKTVKYETEKGNTYSFDAMLKSI
ncbi:MAG: glycoside hydrolase family 95 protein [Sedimentisphaerales bacterium]|nr:glycoside hydrolase family 95 protein [Sedimentisphaerales bacterium]